jgi:outer membrane receptor protein involved in Fe transport
MPLRRFGNVLVAAAASLLCATAASAETTGSLSGQVVDAETQAPVPNAVVVAQGPALQGEQTVVTDSTGSFEISLLPAGVYAVVVQREGYNPFTETGLTVHIGRTIKVRLQLIPDTVQFGVMEIVAQRPVIAATSAQTGQVITREQLELIPYGRNTRDFEAAAIAVPGVERDHYGFQINGSTSPETSYIIDGVSVNDPAFGTQGTKLLQDFVQEVDVITGGYQAEYGRSLGGVINAVTKSGGNEFHGSVFANWSPLEASRKAIGGPYAIALQRAQRYNLDFGAEVGGPIIKDKLWFFVGFAPQFVSTNNRRIIQAQKDDGAGSAVLDANGNPVVVEVARKNYAQTTTSYQFTGKLTWLLNPDHNLALALYGNPSKVSGGAPTTPRNVNANEGVFLYDQSLGSIDGALRYQGKLFNKSMLVEATGGFHRQKGSAFSNNISPSNVGSRTGAELQNTSQVIWRDQDSLLNPLFDDGTLPDYQRGPAVVAACTPHANGFNPCPVLGYRTGGAGAVIDSTLTRFVQELKLSNFFELAGHHRLKYGVNVEEDKYDVTKLFTGGQSFFAINGASPGGGILYYGVGFADSTVRKLTRNLTAAFFAQDSWSILDKVVLDAGVRVEYQHMTPAKDQGLLAVTPDNSFTITSVMPRLGLIWDPTGRGLSRVYASFGRFYEYIPLDLADRDLSPDLLVVSRADGGSCSNPKDPRTCAKLGGSGFSGSAVTVDPNLQGQYADEYQVGAEYQIYRDISVGVAWVRKQIGRVVEDMSVDNGATYFVSNPGERGKLGYGGYTPSGQFVIEPPPERKYDALTVSVNKQFGENYLLSASYTYSYLRGNYPGLFTADYGNQQLDPNATSEYDLVAYLPNRRGPLPGDVPNSFKFNGAYVYEVDASTTVNLGASFDARQGGPSNYLSAGNPVYGAGSVFVLPRGSGPRLPWQTQLNLRVGIARKLNKNYTLGFSIDAFNVLNRQAATVVDQNYTYQSTFPIVNGTVKDLAYLKQTSGQAVALNKNFQQPLDYQLPFSLRLGARLSF